LTSIQRVHEFVGVMTFEEYTEDEKTASAVERQLQIITEASIRLTDEDRALCPGIPWQALRGLGNRLRHAYHTIDNEQIWNIVCKDLPPLKEAIERTMREHFPDIPLP
jgi:uncharacterized protein with HEPN domain